MCKKQVKLGGQQKPSLHGQHVMEQRGREMGPEVEWEGGGGEKGKREGSEFPLQVDNMYTVG